MLKAEAALDAAKKLRELEVEAEEKRLAREREIIALELETKLANIDSSEISSRSSRSSKKSRTEGAARSSLGELDPPLPLIATHGSKIADTAAWVRTQSLLQTNPVNVQSRMALTLIPDNVVRKVNAEQTLDTVPGSRAELNQVTNLHVGTGHTCSISNVPEESDQLKTVSSGNVGEEQLSTVCEPDVVTSRREDELQHLRYEMAAKEEAYHRSLNAAYTYASHCRPTPADDPSLRPPAPPDPKPGDNKFLARQTVGKELPTFSGLPEEWPTFVNLFESTTKECGFSNVENLVRLQKCLRGKAEEAVKGLLAIPDNVNQVMQILELRFGRPEVIFSSLINKAKAYVSIRADDFEALISFSTSVQTLVSTMKLLRSAGHLHNPQLRQELVQTTGELAFAMGECSWIVSAR